MDAALSAATFPRGPPGSTDLSLRSTIPGSFLLLFGVYKMGGSGMGQTTSEQNKSPETLVDINI